MVKSIIIAAAVGAAIMWGYEQTTAPKTCTSCATPYDGLLPGALVGAGVQIALRMTGVS